MTGVSDERWERANDVEYVKRRIAEYELQDFDGVFDQEADGFGSVGDRGWHPDTAFGGRAVTAAWLFAFGVLLLGYLWVMTG